MSSEIENYLRRMSEIRRTGSAVKETSFYGTLETFFNEVGKTLKPKVRCDLGEKTFDVYLNNIAYWRNVPEKVWNYTIGGYQVLKKWLSYREFELLGRALTLDEISEVTNMIRRLSAILLLETQLNENYAKTKTNFYQFN